ncbi:MAG: O-antigen ligase family protein [Vicingaceae bacterium]
MPGKLKITHQVFFVMTAIVVTFPLWPLRFSAGMIVLWFLSAIVHLSLNGRKQWNRNSGFFVLFISLFALYAISFFMYEMPKGSEHYLERRLSLLVFPLGFYLVDPGFQKKQRSWILLCFELSSFVLTAFIAIKTIPLIITHWDALQTGTGFNWAFRNHVEKLVNIHPTYLSIFLLFAVFLKVFRMIEKDMNQSWYAVVWNAFQMGLMLLCCLLLSARGPLIAFGIALTIFFFQVNWKRTIIGIAAILPVVALLFLNVPAIGGRFNELIEPRASSEEVQMNSTNIRREIYRCSKEILEQNWLSGIGIGNVQPALNKCYEANDQEKLMRMEFNTHNEYAHTWISNGIIGIFIFVLMLLLPLIHSFRMRDLPYQAFLILMIVCFFTENVLARQHGVVFYAFFNTLFAFHLISPLKD